MRQCMPPGIARIAGGLLQGAITGIATQASHMKSCSDTCLAPYSPGTLLEPQAAGSDQYSIFGMASMSC